MLIKLVATDSSKFFITSGEIPSALATCFNTSGSITSFPSSKDIFCWLIMGFFMGASIGELKGLALKLEIPLRGKMAIQRILTNPTYAGLIQLPAYKDAPAKMIKGRFPGIVSEGVYYRVQELVKLGNPVLIEDSRFPLRGVLKCHCGRMLTAA